MKHIDNIKGTAPANTCVSLKTFHWKCIKADIIISDFTEQEKKFSDAGCKYDDYYDEDAESFCIIKQILVENA